MAKWILLAICCLAAVTADNIVPRKMRQLYKQHKRYGVQGDVNTIRYIAAHKGSESSASKLLFNLDSLQKQNETFIGAELHFYRRSVEALSTIQVDAFEVSSYYISLVERKRLSPAAKGWQQLNITDTVRRCTNTIKTNNRLGIAFSDVRSDFITIPVNMPQFLRHHELPFLLLYSHNTRTLEMDQITDHTKLSSKSMADELNSMVNPESGKPDIRTRRDVYNNKIDELSDILMDKHDVEDAYNEITNKIEVEEADSKLFKSENIPDIKNVESKKYVPIDIQYIPWPKHRAKHSKVRERSGKLSTHKKETESNILVSVACGRKPLRINMEDIGWGSKVIEPRRIDAFYCSGECSFPFAYGKQMTNHATLQSLVTSVAQKPKIPQPCCVPDQLEPVTLLYYDVDGNIVLKTYQDMSVKSCVCR